MKKIFFLISSLKYALKHKEASRACGVLAAVMFLTAAVFLFWRLPAEIRYKSVCSEINKINRQRAGNVQAREIYEKFNKALFTADFIEDGMSKKTGEAALFGKIIRTGKKYGLKIRIEAPVEDSAAGGACINREIGVSGEYSSVRKFMVDLRNMKPAAVIDRLVMERGREGVRAVISAKIYRGGGR
ncbi:MAG: hypothetical protein ACOC4H_01795 [bacterium]